MKHSSSFLRTIALAAVVLFLASCESLQFSMMKDDELVAGGIKAWNADKATSAKGYWNAIKEPGLKAQWLGRIDQLDTLETGVDTAAALPATAEAPLVAGWDTAMKSINDFPPELKLPDRIKTKMVPLAKSIIDVRLHVVECRGHMGRVLKLGIGAHPDVRRRHLAVGAGLGIDVPDKVKGFLGTALGDIFAAQIDRLADRVDIGRLGRVVAGFFLASQAVGGVALATKGN